MTKYLGILLIFLLGFGTTLYAQPGKGKGGQGEQAGKEVEKSAEERAQNRTKRLTNKLALTADQNAQMYQHLLAVCQEMDKLKGLDKGPEKKAQRQALRDKEEQGIKAILTPAQWETYQKMKEERKEQNEHGGGKGKGAK